MRNINLKSYKIWIIIFGLFNIFFLLWCLDILPILKKLNKQETEIITISPENKFIKINPPKDKQFPNEKSKLWDAYKDDKQKLKNNKEDVNNKQVVNTLEKKGNNELKNLDNDPIKTQNSNLSKDRKDDSNNLTLSKKVINNQLEIDQAQPNKENNKISSDPQGSNLNKTDENKIDNKNKIKKNSFYVQTASLSKKELVAKEWNRIQKKYKLDVNKLIFITEKIKLKNNQTFYRLLVGKFKSQDDAKVFCNKININKLCIIKIIE